MIKDNSEREIVVMWTLINNDTITNLRITDEEDKNLEEIIIYMAILLQEQGKEIFEIGHTYLVSEDEVLISVYEDELEEQTL